MKISAIRAVKKNLYYVNIIFEQLNSTFNIYLSPSTTTRYYLKYFIVDIYDSTKLCVPSPVVCHESLGTDRVLLYYKMLSYKFALNGIFVFQEECKMYKIYDHHTNTNLCKRRRRFGTLQYFSMLTDII